MTTQSTANTTRKFADENWTVAYRRTRRSGQFRRLDLSFSWENARIIATQVYKVLGPDAEVYCTGNAAAEAEGRVCDEDVRNILVDNGTKNGARVGVRDLDEVPAELALAVVLPVVAEAEAYVAEVAKVELEAYAENDLRDELAADADELREWVATDTACGHPGVTPATRALLDALDAEIDPR